MIELNLTNKSEGAVPYTKVKYPDGQVSIQIPTNMIEHLPIPDEVLIKTRMNSYEDVFSIISAADALRSWGVRDVSLFIACFLTQRSDREFIPGHSFDLWEMCEIIKQQHFKTITVFHPHSDVLPALLKTRLNQVKILDNKQYVQLAIANVELKHNTKAVLVSPDAGAFKWVFKLADKLQRECVSGNKSRDLVTGDITTRIHADIKGRICIIVDDYCDGGRTFIQLATELKAQGAAAVYLYTSHGLYSNGFDTMKEIIDGAYTTNSINDEANNFLTRFKII